MLRDGLWWPFVRDPGHAAVLVDFDGSLAPIVDDPARAVPVASAKSVLTALVSRLGLVAVVSGRHVSFLRPRLPIAGLSLAGQYGLEREEDGRVVEAPAVLGFRDAVAAAAAEAEATWPELLVERKGTVAVTVHWRTRPDQAPDLSALRDLAARHGLQGQAGRMAWELRPPVEVDKGTAVEALLAACGTDAAVAFAGDDAGDLPAFDALDRLAARRPGTGIMRIGVRSTEAPSELLARADVVVDGPEGLAECLRGLVDALSRTSG
jgi:trehalose 6-phosphate phosphatase